MTPKPIRTDADWYDQKRWLIKDGYKNVADYVEELKIQIERMNDQISKLEWILAAEREKK